MHKPSERSHGSHGRERMRVAFVVAKKMVARERRTGISITPSTLALPRGSYPGAAEFMAKAKIPQNRVRCRCTNANQLPHCDIGAKMCLLLADIIWKANR